MGQMLGRLIAASGIEWLGWLFLALCAGMLLFIAGATLYYVLYLPLRRLIRQ